MTETKATALSEAERAIMLEPCVCGHTLNDHGDMGGCWTCGDNEGDEDCWVTCEALVAERVGRIVTAHVTAAEDRMREAVAGVLDPGELDCVRVGLPCTSVNPPDRWCRACRITAALATEPTT